SDPGNLGKHSTKRRAHNLFLASHTFHQRRDFLCPGKSFTCHSWKCSSRADNGYHVSSPSTVRDPLRPQLLQQRLRLFQIARVEPLREPPIHRSKQFARLLHLALGTPEPCEAHGGAEFPGFSLLLTSD